MEDRSRIVLTMLIGAGIGAALGYLYLTESGRRVRDSIEPRIDDVVAEVRRWRRTVEKAREASGEAWRSLAAVTDSSGTRSSAWDAARAR